MTDQVSRSWQTRLGSASLWLLLVSVSLESFSKGTGQYLQPAAVAATFAVALLILVAIAPRERSRSHAAARRIMMAALAISGAWPWLQNPTHSLGLYSWAIAHLGAMAIVASADQFSKQDARFLLRGGIAVSLIMIAASPVAFTVDSRVLIDSPGRLSGAFGHPNVTATAAGALMILSFGEKRLATLDRLLAGAGLVLSASLTAGIAVAAALCVFRVRSRGKRFAVVAGGLAAFASVAIYSVVLGQRFEPTTATNRGEIWNWSAGAVSQHDGFGIATFALIREQTSLEWFHAHNQMLMDLVTGGWVLALASIVLVTSLGITAVEVGTRSGLSVWVLLMLSAAAEVPFFYDYPGYRLILLFVLAVAVSSQGLVERSGKNEGVVVDTGTDMGRR